MCANASAFPRLLTWHGRIFWAIDSETWWSTNFAFQYPQEVSDVLPLGWIVSTEEILQALWVKDWNEKMEI